MYRPVYNSEEKALIDLVHSSFEKKELDTNVAIGSVNYTGKTYNYYGGLYEGGQAEGFFRGISDDRIDKLCEEDNSLFFPARYKPIPWWQIDFQRFSESSMSICGYCMSPYGRHYYLPFYLLATICELNAGRRGYEFGLLQEDPWNGLSPPEALEGKDVWREVESLPPYLKDKFNKKDLRLVYDPESFLTFLSLFNEKEKKCVSEFVRRFVKEPLSACFEDSREESERFKACWSF